MRVCVYTRCILGIGNNKIRLMSGGNLSEVYVTFVQFMRQEFLLRTMENVVCFTSVWMPPLQRNSLLSKIFLHSTSMFRREGSM